MSDSLAIRLVEPIDAKRLLEIYTPFVLETAISFESTPPSLDEFRQRVISYSSKSPWIVGTIDEFIVGYAYATAHRSREAYQWSQETTVYVDERYRKQGIATSLYTKLLACLREMGFVKAIAVITIPNNASIGFHKSFGFQHIGEMKNIGFKFNQWRTTSWWDLDLQTDGYQPTGIKPMESIKPLFS